MSQRGTLMRVGINTLFMVPGEVGGTETYLRESLLALTIFFNDIECVLFTNNENDPVFRELLQDRDNVSFVCLNFNGANRPLRIVLEQMKLPLVAKRYNLDLLWSPGYTAPLFSFCPQVVTVCDLQYMRYPEDMTGLERNVLNILVRGACRRCEKVIAISEFSRQEIIQLQFAVPDKVHTVLLGVDESFGTIQSEQAAALLFEDWLPDDRPFILCVAHTYPHKKVQLAVQGFSDMLDQIPHRLVVVGKERRGEEVVITAVEQLSDQNRYTRFKDGVPYPVLQSLFQQADMFILPSAYEGFGLPVIEAMLAGTPVVTTHEASLAEVAEGKAFIMKSLSRNEVARNIEEIVSLSPEQREKKTAAAKKWAQSFTWEQSVKTMFEVFRELA